MDGSPSTSGGIVRLAATLSHSPRSKRKLDLIAPDALSRSTSRKERVLSSATRVYILPDKLSEEQVDALRARVSDLGGMNASMAFANLILTSVRAEKRIIRQVDEEALVSWSDVENCVAGWLKHAFNQSRRVPVLHLSWLYDCGKEGLLQPYDRYRVFRYPAQPSEPSPVTKLIEPIRDDESATEEESGGESRFGSRFGSRPVSEEGCEDEVCQASLERDNGPVWQNVEYACLRPSPLQSRYNQPLINELEVLRLQRIQSGRQEMNATAYGRAISAVKALPFALAPDPSKARHIKGIGPKIAKLIAQFYADGHIAEVESIRKDQAFSAMTAFMELYGVGPKRAREFYSQGARTLDDVMRMGGSLGTHLHIQDCLRILPDLRSKIPRAEVVEIAGLICAELDTIRPGCLTTICGGFRRGKVESNDVDLVITDPNPASVSDQITCMEDLLRQLKKRAIITHVVNVTTPSSTFETVFSHLDIAEVVVLPPASSVAPVPRHRRVDIIFCPHHTYGAAVLGWTGSRQFERDLRLLAKHRGFKFHSTGLVHQGDTQPLDAQREEDIFALLKIPYMPPHLRNCDA